ncbi:2-oxoglutarate dehydrogenase complex dihydrolipoyllysine-residue succinyltransferase [bacterium]|nr:2-oxoglutarate dehydrogenase complex dihydrolipoyllysine-residue succinyltransferase [bacterium]UNM08283.1 MAG: 2-oxoglutarate dehydrogenase complex dihydrolipoyllysine-residue succinyltransferase [Planctomycetales bacterium]
MAVEIRIPSAGESVTEVIVSEWMKKEGDYVEEDDFICELESDKASMELPAPISGIITKILKPAGEPCEIGEVIATMEEAEAPADEKPQEQPKQEAPRAEAPKQEAPAASKSDNGSAGVAMPSAQRILAQKGIDAADVKGNGKDGRILKEDAEAATPAKYTEAARDSSAPQGPRSVEKVRMSPMRKTIARRLVESKQGTAQLTTFNEIDMSAVMELRNRYKDSFEKKYGIKLGFMSFFAKAAIDALKEFPQVNAEITDDGHLVYHNYYDIGVAIGGGKGLVVPVIRNAELLSFAQTELAIADFAKRAQANDIELEELEGGTFTISNGGVYGSMMSTPILNPPQSGILGLHNIVERPVAINGEVKIRPIMYVALTYDHRVIDGRESVTFLRRIKDCIEDPSRMLLEI